MEQQAADLSAKLLATENLSVIRARTGTASFDIETRVLTIPMWKNMTPQIEEMLVGHEVGHALYTGEQYFKPIEANPKIKSYLNVLEDVRIEKLIKRKYPGMRKRMSEGYRQLNDRDFFGTKQIQDFDQLLLIDKINLYYKAGFQCGVKFTPEEKIFVNRAERCETVDEVIKLAEDVWEYSKQKAEEEKEQKKNRAKSKPPEDDEDEEDHEQQPSDSEDSDESEETPDESEEETNTDPTPETNGNSSQDEEIDLESKTERAFKQNLDGSSDNGTEFVYWKFDKKYFNDPLIPFTTILNETKTPEEWAKVPPSNNIYQNSYRNITPEQLAQIEQDQLRDYEKFKIESARTVNYLVKEFEMKKSAQLHKRAQISKSGSLDMKKIYAYKLQDDLFKRVQSLPEGKNHGMLMLLDWSGSMSSVLIDTIKQVINLAMFCRRIQIPFRVLAFTSDYHNKHVDGLAHNAYIKSMMETPGMLNSNSNFHLLELFSDKMSNSEFNSMCRRSLHYKFTWNKGYSISGTPLNEALVWVYHNIGDYIKQCNIEKMTMITLTDGDGSALNGWKRGIADQRSEVVNNAYRTIRQRHFVKDEVTQKTYEINKYGGVQTTAILQMIKDRYNCAVVGFYICDTGRRSLRSALASNLPSFKGSVEETIDSWKDKFRDDGFVSLSNTGRDELFLIAQTSTKITEGELEVTSDMRANTVAKNFTKYMNVKRTSRVLLNRFVALIA